MKILYTAKAKTTGGRDGHTETDDGTLKLDLSLPKSLGGPGKPGATNPEQLFAAGYSACFESAIRHVARLKKIQIPALSVEAEVSLTPAETGFALLVSLHPLFEGVPQAQCEELVHTAHKVCPYSNAVKGNIDVKITIN
ncbi:MAG TPA: organic hydroperoxide resistance protein [Bdellovibrionota bacterium]|jgi:Ohr subfamily peroxiredoxin